VRIVRFQLEGREPARGILDNDDQVLSILGDICGQWAPSGERHPLASVRLLAPVQPPNILAIGLNYRGHAHETGHAIPSAPVLFIKATTAVIGPDQPIVLPAAAPDEVDYEAELVVVIGKKARNVSRQDAASHILGYTCGNDVSARDCQLRLDSQWARGKSFDTFAPLGPWIETQVERAGSAIRARLNGVTVQESHTSDLIFDVADLVSYLSHQMTRLPGTVIYTGTPSGVGHAREPNIYLRPGDVVEIEIEGIGVLRNPVVAES
jgi:2-keto-4-pentenoate hydratase/2-oxohepta-3-ene-1,7-dioic acid hydratase in catechol pathway